MSDDSNVTGDHSGDTIEYVTVMIANQLFGVPIKRVEDVFFPKSMTPVPLAPVEIAGILNLRGRIVTAICLRRRLGLPDRDGASAQPMAVGVEHKGESYGLIIDEVGEVLRLEIDSLEACPGNLDKRWRSVATGVHKLEGKLLVVLDVERVLETELSAAA